MEMKVFISTMDGVKDNSLLPEKGYSLFFINQGRRAADMVNVDSKGLSLSRNVGISKSKPGDIVLLTDNDVSFSKNFAEQIKNLFLQNENADIITFQAENKDGEPFKSNYPVKKFKHNRLSIMKVSSIEIAFRLGKRIPFFDEGFGLGTEIPIGEENIFLSDCLKNGCRAIYVPLKLVKHNDDVHSGTFFSLKISRYRELVFRRVYGALLGRFIFTLFLIKNRKRLNGGFFKHYIYTKRVK